MSGILLAARKLTLNNIPVTMRPGKRVGSWSIPFLKLNALMLGLFLSALPGSNLAELNGLVRLTRKLERYL
jgi:hypothetical protein